MGDSELVTEDKRLYEALFLVDSAQAAADWQGINDAVEKALTRHGGEIVSINKWDERKLAYEVQGKDRGTYILVYFNGDPAGITGIERDVQLSEQMIRVMILRTDKMSQEDLDRDTPVAAAEKKVAAAALEAEKRAAEAEAKAKAEAEKKASEAEETEAKTQEEQSISAEEVQSDKSE